jgi:hypothetical protein
VFMDAADDESFVRALRERVADLLSSRQSVV